MSRKTVSAVIGSFLVVGFALGAVQGCGSSSSSNGTNIMSALHAGLHEGRAVPGRRRHRRDRRAMRAKLQRLFVEHGGTCANESATAMAAQACAAKTTCAECRDLRRSPSCLRDSGSGTGGTRATGGTSGATGGTSGATGGTSGATGGTSGATGGTSGATGGSAAPLRARSATRPRPAARPSAAPAACDRRERGGLHLDAGGKSGDDRFPDCQTLLNAGAALSAACR